VHRGAAAALTGRDFPLQRSRCKEMRRTATQLPSALGAIALLIGAAHPAYAAKDDFPRVEKALNARVSKGEFMGAILIARGSQVIFSKGYGNASVEWGIPNSPRTRFRIGSVTKQFTAAATLMLAERGRLKIDDLISKYMPEAPPAWKSISFLNLLTHTSGIPDLTTFSDFDATEPFPATPGQLVQRFLTRPLDFPPGSGFRYSNSGYILLGYLLEKITGQTYQQLIQKNILDPLGMKDSGYDSNTRIIARHASGYVPGKQGLTVAGYVDMTIPFAAGGLYSTTEDLLRWQNALYGGKLLTAESLARMTTPFKKDYAFGVAVDPDTGGNRVIWHDGSIEGFSASIVYVPADRLSVIVLSNLEGSSARDARADILAITKHEFTVPK